MATTESIKAGCCCANSSACCSEQESNQEKRQIHIDFMYIDLSVCTRCKGTGGSLDDAVADVEAVLKAVGIVVAVNKIHITSEQQAQELRFASSPTIRVNGHDIQLEVKESLCESCGDLCGDEVDCRVWVFQGKEYYVPPKAMIVDAILREVYGGRSSAPAENEEFVLPDNLKNFFQVMEGKG